MAASFKSALLLVVVFIAAVAPQIYSSIGDYKPISNVQDPKIIALAQFALNEHLKTTSDHLTFSNVLRAWYQVVSGTSYKLAFSATRDRLNAVEKFEAVVWVKLDGSKKLISFDGASTFMAHKGRDQVQVTTMVFIIPQIINSNSDESE
ncbi:hypothetical protein QQ045_033251 [Rhodiola kirilowii]